ncbi:tetratricopeptide repeat protein [Chryseosolibacter indicus]|uniref:Tetratricopeptide repeat protein n=1 Tax=Chryseosolibacter indicus TaxID=2782351 RepID=A0ABS5VUY1_9BACT|nr:hypothetical protein [Chryseosolibacter indicus]MBT1704858.1 hypothetical protein [Chryseosolibacter indicus]
MKIVFVLISLLFFSNDPLKISKINSAKRDAKQAFNSGDYKTAIAKYRYIVDSLGVNEDEVKLNLANAYYLSKDTANAFSTYQALTASGNKVVSSKANQQLGVMSNKQGKQEEALNYFKQAVKAHPENDDARYNYEMLKHKLDEKKKQDEQNKKDQNKNQEPSEFAKRLKAQADKLVAQKQYQAAYDLMQNGLKQDQTVSTYQDYINRIKDVAEINK